MYVKKIALYSILLTNLYMFFPLSIFPQQFMSGINITNSEDTIESEPSIAVDNNNNVHIVWTSAYYNPDAPDNVAFDIFYTKNKMGSFAEPVKISVPNKWYSRNPSIAIDRVGNAHVVFRRSENQVTVFTGDDIYYVNNVNGNFDNLLNLTKSVEIYTAEDLLPPYTTDTTYFVKPHIPIVHCDDNNFIHVTMKAYQNFSVNELLLYLNNVGGDWKLPKIAVEADIFYFPGYDSYLDGQNNLHFIFPAEYEYEGETDRGIYYIHNLSGEFSIPVKVSEPGFGSDSRPKLSIDSDQKAHIVYRQSITYNDILAGLYYTNNVSGTFDFWTPIRLNHEPLIGTVYYIPDITIDNSNFVHVTYKKNSTIIGGLGYGNNISGNFEFAEFYNDNSNWYIGTQQFALGKDGSIHFTYWEYSDIFYFYLPSSVGIEEKKFNEILFNYNLFQNHPNPFNPETIISFDLPKTENVELAIYNVKGQKIKTIINQRMMSGNHKMHWNGKDEFGNSVSTGVYIYGIRTDNYVAFKKMLLIK